MKDVLASEWRKFRALPANRTVLLVAVAVTVGISVLVALFGGGTAFANLQAEGDYEVVFYGAILGTWAFIFLGAQFTAMEFRTGLADLTFTATPRRGRVLLAKAVVVGGVGLVSGLVISVVNLAVTQGTLAMGGFPTLDLTDLGLLRAVLLYITLNMAVQGVLGCLVAALVHHAFGAMVLTVLVTVLPVTMAEFFGPGYAGIVPRWVPGAVVESLSGVAEVGSPGFLPLPLALLAVALWFAVLGGLAHIRLTRGDAR